MVENKDSLILFVLVRARESTSDLYNLKVVLLSLQIRKTF